MTDTRVLPATGSDKMIIAALMTPYLLELRQPTDYPYLSQYWQETKHRFPYLIMSDESVVGFILVRKTPCFEIAEFYIKPEWRRKSIGREAVMQVLARHAGSWLVSFDISNLAGKTFWMKTLEQHLKDLSISPVHNNRITLAFDS